MKRERLLTRSVVLVAALCALVPSSSAFPTNHFAGAFAHPVPQSTAPVPIPSPPDILASQASAGAALTNYKSWIENSFATHDTEILNIYAKQIVDETSITALQNQIANMPAGPAGPVGATGPQGVAGPIGPSLNSPQADSSSIVASSPAVSLVRTLCYPSNAYIGNVPATGQSIDFTVNVAQAGSYPLQACVASLGGAKTYHFEFPVGTKVGASISALNTGSYQLFAYQQTGVSLQLPAGASTVRVVLENGGMNFAGFNYH